MKEENYSRDIREKASKKNFVKRTPKEVEQFKRKKQEPIGYTNDDFI